MKHKKIDAAGALCCFCVLALFLTLCEAFLPYKEEKVYNGLIRLHIIANSDSEEDQKVKLKVRDELIRTSGSCLSDCNTLDEAKQKLASLLDEIKSKADSTLKENGLSYVSETELGNERYDTRVYDGIAFPKGEYLSLRVILGDGKGKNWWCVLFPPLCLSAASAKKGLSSIGMDSETQKTFTSSKKKYRIKFKLLEWLG